MGSKLIKLRSTFFCYKNDQYFIIDKLLIINIHKSSFKLFILMADLVLCHKLLVTLCAIFAIVFGVIQWSVFSVKFFVLCDVMK